MVFCNIEPMNKEEEDIINVTILILVDGFLQFLNSTKEKRKIKKVTILILVDGFLQYKISIS